VAFRGLEGSLPQAQEAPARSGRPRGRDEPDLSQRDLGHGLQFDETRNGKQLKLLNIQDIFTRECLAVKTERSITADDVTTLLDRLVAEHGVPAYLRCDNGPEFAAYAIADWCRFNGSATTFIDPGSPWQNGHIESFNSRLRDEFLNGQLFESLLEAQVLLETGDTNTIMNVSTVLFCYLTPVDSRSCGCSKTNNDSHWHWTLRGVPAVRLVHL